MMLLRAYACLEDYEAVEREAAAALAGPALAEPVKLVLVPGARCAGLVRVRPPGSGRGRGRDR